MNLHLCPRCGEATPARQTNAYATHQDRWYICKCRHAFKTLTNLDGSGAKVTSQSPLPGEVKTKEAAEKSGAVIFAFPCPDCGGNGRIKMTERRPDGYWRRHKCRSCTRFFFSRINDEGVSIFRKMPSKLAIDI